VRNLSSNLNIPQLRQTHEQAAQEDIMIKRNKTEQTNRVKSVLLVTNVSISQRRRIEELGKAGAWSSWGMLAQYSSTAEGGAGGCSS